MFLCDVTEAFFNAKKEMSVEERLVTRLKVMGYVGINEKPTRQYLEKIIVGIANSEPSTIKTIGEPLVYKFMYEGR